MVGSEVAAVCDILIFKNIAFFRNCLLCLSLGVFYREVVWIVCRGCFRLILRLIDEIVCRVCLLCFERIID